jgi:hypothetical protein
LRMILRQAQDERMLCKFLTPKRQTPLGLSLSKPLR